MAYRNVIVLMILLCFVGMYLALQCMDDDGNPVDWFIVYKLPKILHTTSRGVEYFYMDVNSQEFQLSNHDIDEHDGAVFNTLQQIYSVQARTNNSLFYAMYNDELPKSVGEVGYIERGHTKGVMGFDTSRGFWLIHSVPHFPDKQTDGYHWPYSAYTYGQNLLCITFPTSILDKIGEAFRYNYPHVYDYDLPDWVKTKYPTMAKVMTSDRVRVPPWYNIAELISVGKQTFTCFSKASQFGQDLYTGLVAPYVKSNLYTETWLNGRGRMESNCSLKYHVQNIVSISLPQGMSFTDSKDHSKWAVSVNSTRYWVCIGDINRQLFQMQRGGGTVCFQNKNVWNIYRNSIVQVEKCN